MVVIGLGKNLLFKSVLAHCGLDNCEDPARSRENENYQLNIQNYINFLLFSSTTGLIGQSSNRHLTEQAGQDNLLKSIDNKTIRK